MRTALLLCVVLQYMAIGLGISISCDKRRGYKVDPFSDFLISAFWPLLLIGWFAYLAAVQDWRAK